MKLIYTLLPLCLFAACKQTSTPTQESGDVATPIQSSTQTMTPSSDKPDAKPQEKPAAKPVGDARYIGMTQEAASALAKKEGVPSRVVSVDGQVRMVTMDHRPERLNFTVVAGKVTKVTHG